MHPAIFPLISVIVENPALAEPEYVDDFSPMLLFIALVFVIFVAVIALCALITFLILAVLFMAVGFASATFHSVLVGICSGSFRQALYSFAIQIGAWMGLGMGVCGWLLAEIFSRHPGIDFAFAIPLCLGGPIVGGMLGWLTVRIFLAFTQILRKLFDRTAKP